MRKSWYAAWAAAGMAANCAGMLGSECRSVMAAPPANGVVVGAPQPTWTDKLKAPFAKMGEAFKEKKPKQPVEPYEPPFDPNATPPELYVAMAQMSQRGGNVPNARLLYQKAIAKDSKNLDALLGAARMEDREGNLDVAISLYQRAMQADPQSATARNDLGLCLARRGDVAGAQRALEEAIRIAPEKTLYRNNIAKVLVEVNQLQPATNHLSAVYPPAIAHYNMAVLLAERGRQDEATDYLQTALAIDPALAPAQQMLALQSGKPAVATPAMQSPAGQRSVVQSPPRLTLPTSDVGESILPTPQVVATVPWQSPDSIASTPPEPRLPAEQPGDGEKSPALLPPTN